MSDLIEKFFREDLTEAEEKTLSEQLLHSEEAADRFGALSEQKYVSYGLTEPVLGDGGFLKTWGKLILLLLAGLTILGVTGWAMLCCVRQRVTAEIPAETAPLLGSVAPIEKTSPSQPVASSTVRKVVRQVVEAPPTPVMTDHSPAKGKGLQIVFRMSTEGRAAIRVLDPSGAEVRRLFDGTMKTGSWSVDWDGHLADGKAARPGLYHIEVQTNGIVKSREVRIR